MATEFKLPDLGENIASGDVVTVFVSEGDIVKPGQTQLARMFCLAPSRAMHFVSMIRPAFEAQ